MIIGTCLLLYQCINKKTEFSFKICWTALKSLGCIIYWQFRIKSRIFLRCLQGCFNSNKQGNARGMFKCMWCSQMKKEASPLPPHAALLQIPRQSTHSCKFPSHRGVFVQACAKPLQYRWTQNTGIFLIMQASSHIQIQKERREQLHSTFFGMNRAFNINTEMEVISTIYWILKHLGMFSQTVYLIGWTCGHLILGKICWQRQRNSYLAASHTFSKDWNCFFLL